MHLHKFLKNFPFLNDRARAVHRPAILPGKWVSWARTFWSGLGIAFSFLSLTEPVCEVSRASMKSVLSTHLKGLLLNKAITLEVLCTHFHSYLFESNMNFYSINIEDMFFIVSSAWVSFVVFIACITFKSNNSYLFIFCG